MELLLTDEFLDRARRSPDALRQPVRRIVERASAGEPCGVEPAGDSALVGWTREEEQRVGLWYLAGAQVEEIEAGSAPLASTSRAELRELGVDDARIPDVQRATSLAALRALDLPARVHRRLEFVFVQQLLGAPATREALRRRATSAAHLDRFLHGDITELLLDLDPGQRRIVELGGHGTIVIRGVAGSGKTAVILHRIYRLLAQRSLLERPRVLLLTYNRALMAAARELLIALGLRRGELEVSTFHKWCMDRAGLRSGVLEPKERSEMIWAAREQVRSRTRDSALWRLPVGFWEEEIHRIKGRDIANRAEYASLQRSGAGRALDQRGRELIWLVFEEYRTRCERERRFDFDDVAGLAAQRLAALGPVYDHVFVDEAQDLTVVGLRLVASLPRPTGSLCVAYDAAQSIYERGFRWRDCGIAVSSRRSFELRRNHRNTREILDAAEPLLGPMRRRQVEAKEDELLEPERTRRTGPKPRLIETGRGEECRVIARDIRRLIESEAVPPQNIAVLCYPNRMREQMTEALGAESIAFQKHASDSGIRLADPSVKVLPIKSAKGLEFPVVYLIGSSPAFRRFGSGAEGSEEELRRVLYMAMTRAMSALVVVHERGGLLPMLRHLGAS
ncbi:MAG: UvrD-helicase domain-containing protein [Myxococcales bacterium]|jgi:superfamily I DNA/RNA helicase